MASSDGSGGIVDAALTVRKEERCPSLFRSLAPALPDTDAGGSDPARGHRAEMRLAEAKLVDPPGRLLTARRT